MTVLCNDVTTAGRNRLPARLEKLFVGVPGQRACASPGPHIERVLHVRISQNDLSRRAAHTHSTHMRDKARCP